ncbi:MAG: MTH1187 family thiamine-binding protein [Deltaproteobacteria bacterium]|nr:MTH1187 family thiamine-binding protein [Deltaproteobacteria bacterium]MBW2284430.1 MTH1187 family thiamine-binding protein [Deltaproteobacteria bacterium]
MALMEFSMIPLDKGASYSTYVAGSMKMIEESGLDYRMNPMGTVVEGEWDELIALLTRCYKNLEDISDRVMVTVKFDCRKGVVGALDKKIKSVEEKVGRSLKT